MATFLRRFTTSASSTSMYALFWSYSQAKSNNFCLELPGPTYLWGCNLKLQDEGLWPIFLLCSLILLSILNQLDAYCSNYTMMSSLKQPETLENWQLASTGLGTKGVRFIASFLTCVSIHHSWSPFIEIILCPRSSSCYRVAISRVTMALVANQYTGRSSQVWFMFPSCCNVVDIVNRWELLTSSH